MSYLKFDKNLLINLEQSLRLEVLRTNQSGAYHCTTIVGANTRKQHGLLVIPVPEIDDNSHVLLSSLDETVIQHGAPFNLGLHRYSGGVYSPNGHKYIREYDCERVPTHTFRVGGVILKREKIFITNENRILIRYTLVDAHSKTTLQFRPFLAFRNANDLCVENQVASRDYKEVSNGISTCMYDGYPELFMQVNHKPKFVFDPHWYKGIEYIKDLERGIPYTEDLYVPGYFEVDMKKGDTIIFSAGVSEVNTRQLTKMYEDEIKTRTPRTSFYNCLKNSAKQFYMTNADGHYLFAGYPWFKVRARDEFIALPGCTLSNHHRPDFEAIMDTAKEAFTRWMETGEPDKHLQGIDLPDVPLWAAWAIHTIPMCLQHASVMANWWHSSSTLLSMASTRICKSTTTAWCAPMAHANLCRGWILRAPMALRSFLAPAIWWNSTRCGITRSCSCFRCMPTTSRCRAVWNAGRRLATLTPSLSPPRSLTTTVISTTM